MISGRGSNLQALIKASQCGELDAEITLVISNKPLAKGLELAQKAGIATLVILPTTYASHESYEKALCTQLKIAQIDYLVLAGYMKLLGQTVFKHYKAKIINIHPSLLPKFKGIHAQRQALEAGVSESGCTVHYVIPEMDAGPIIAQRHVPVLAEDTEESLSQRILLEEHILYPQALQAVFQGEHKDLEKKII
eukprot:COSAG01_NODE_1_length_100484_cov_170.446142_21_plen_193_part_00